MKTYERIQEDFWLIYFTLSATSLTNRLLFFLEQNMSMTLKDWYEALGRSFLIPLVAMGVIFYTIKWISQKSEDNQKIS